MPLSANFRREMLTAIKNAKKKREEQSPDDSPPVLAAEDDVVRTNSQVLAKPVAVASNRSFQVNESGGSGANQSALEKKRSQ